jgi:hypothetical protein
MHPILFCLSGLLCAWPALVGGPEVHIPFEKEGCLVHITRNCSQSVAFAVKSIAGVVRFDPNRLGEALVIHLEA